MLAALCLKHCFFWFLLVYCFFVFLVFPLNWDRLGSHKIDPKIAQNLNFGDVFARNHCKTQCFRISFCMKNISQEHPFCSLRGCTKPTKASKTPTIAQPKKGVQGKPSHGSNRIFQPAIPRRKGILHLRVCQIVNALALLCGSLLVFSQLREFIKVRLQLQTLVVAKSANERRHVGATLDCATQLCWPVPASSLPNSQDFHSDALRHGLFLGPSSCSALFGKSC